MRFDPTWIEVDLTGHPLDPHLLINRVEVTVSASLGIPLRVSLPELRALAKPELERRICSQGPLGPAAALRHAIAMGFHEHNLSQDAAPWARTACALFPEWTGSLDELIASAKTLREARDER